MSLGSEIENQLFAVRRVVLASGWRQGLTSLFTWLNGCVCWQYRPAAAIGILKHLQRTPFTAKGLLQNTGGVSTFIFIYHISNGSRHSY